MHTHPSAQAVSGLRPASPVDEAPAYVKAIAPYRRFVQSQQQQLNEARGELVATEDALLRLRSDIEQR